MKSYYHTKVKKRIILLLPFIIIWIGGLIYRLVDLQVIHHSHHREIVVDQNQNIEFIIPERGTIYDRSGNILARSLPRPSVFYTPFKGESPTLQLKRIKRLQPILHLTDSQIRRIRSQIEKDARFIWIKRKIEPKKAAAIEGLDLSGIHFLTESKRFYPNGSLAAHILGGVNIDDAGSGGIEHLYNSLLAGKNGEGLMLRDAKRRSYRFETLKEPKPGKDLVLTIEETIQYIAEKELTRAVRDSRAEWGTVLVSQPSSGEILAIANTPSSDLNYSQPGRNFAIHHTFDPGSTFKIVTASAALESHKIQMTDTFDCSLGYARIAGKTIRDHHRFDILTFPEVIIHSSNVGTIQISQRLGVQTLHDAISAFGFGRKTGIDLPGEEKGIFRAVKDWTTISPASLSIGYEISVTPIQILQAVNVIANRGVVIPPHIVKSSSFQSDSGSPSTEPRRAISSSTAMDLSHILHEAVREGTGKKAQIEGYAVAGKTGTAQIFDPKTQHYSSRAHRSLFVGFVPADNPVLSIVVVIENPQGAFYGGDVAAPVFREIGSRILRYLHIPRRPENPQPLITAKVWMQPTP